MVRGWSLIYPEVNGLCLNSLHHLCNYPECSTFYKFSHWTHHSHSFHATYSFSFASWGFYLSRLWCFGLFFLSYNVDVSLLHERRCNELLATGKFFIHWEFPSFFFTVNHCSFLYRLRFDGDFFLPERWTCFQLEWNFAINVGIDSCKKEWMWSLVQIV